jgi:hypothetical protein
MKRWTLGRIALVLLILFFFPGWRIFAQALPGFTQVGSVAAPTLTFTTSTLADGGVYQFEVTAKDAAGESTGVLSNVVTVPATGTHTATIVWGASPVDATHSAPTTYVVYQEQTTTSNPPGAAQATVN